MSDIIAEITKARRARTGTKAAEPKQRVKRTRKVKEPDPTDPAVQIAAMSEGEKLAELERIRSQLTSALCQARAEIIAEADLTKDYEADQGATEEPDAIEQ